MACLNESLNSWSVGSKQSPWGIGGPKPIGNILQLLLIPRSPASYTGMWNSLCILGFHYFLVPYMGS